jgi:hypothetical protein
MVDLPGGQGLPGQVGGSRLRLAPPQDHRAVLGRLSRSLRSYAGSGSLRTVTGDVHSLGMYWPHLLKAS